MVANLARIRDHIVLTCHWRCKLLAAAYAARSAVKKGRYPEFLSSQRPAFSRP